MRKIDRSMDYDDPVLAEIYDALETGTDDVELIRSLFPSGKSLSILECFSGTGRILVPLACDGHRLTGIEISEAMTDRARQKLTALPQETRGRVHLVVADALVADWGTGFDVVLLAGNCLYELPSPEAQEECIRRASSSLVSGGHIFIDTTDGSGQGADRSDVGTQWCGLKGSAGDGTRGKLMAKVVSVDERGISRFVRTWHKHHADGIETMEEYTASRYPVSGQEVEVWLARHGFHVLAKYGDQKGTPYGQAPAGRAVFWATHP